MSGQKGRRRFIFKSALAAAGLPLLGSYLPACSKRQKPPIAGKLSGPSFKAGHLLRQGLALVPEQSEEAEVVIIGGGVSGLAARRWLHQHSAGRVVLLELEEATGGNAAAGKNAHTAFPWGAHYLALPNNDLSELLHFLREAGVVTGFEDGRPIYKEEYLCFDPEERLYINGYWQQGLVPNWGVPEAEQKEIARFFDLMETFRQAQGSDGRFAFAIPLSDSSADALYRNLDQVTMAEWLQQEKFTSPHLRWYLNYCCLDDYGCTLEQASAWAGIHYFASRKARPGNTGSERVLTWPEGNNWLVQRLQQAASGDIRTGMLAYRVSLVQDRVAVDYLNLETQQAHRILTRQCLLATPQFVGQRLLQGMPELAGRPAAGFAYSTWLVANITLKKAPAGRGAPLSWDNVLYGSQSLGYVYANHQQLQAFPSQHTITFYLPLRGDDPAQVRAGAYRKTQEEWQEVVIAELEKAHTTIRQQIETLDTWVWGHGMVQPRPGFIWGEVKRQAALPIQNKIFFAHTDLSGISVFEEAFYQGIRAAQQILKVSHDA